MRHRPGHEQPDFRKHGAAKLRSTHTSTLADRDGANTHGATRVTLRGIAASKRLQQKNKSRSTELPERKSEKNNKNRAPHMASTTSPGTPRLALEWSETKVPAEVGSSSLRLHRPRADCSSASPNFR
ncbi:hypothetical protein HPB50_010179 [Hyalomma asiaticum]|uniref:Uncharacterized protein n=1 Tax=Hyalomma asiaticum TaxID=266040 RepID=A0ACB7T0S7_HYAAI|nr:hypothetical protein HPB50_010179 [Hyalomma asiaticum]